MADNNLKNPISISSSRLDATMLPPGMPQSFILYMIQQAQGVEAIATKANESGQGAYDAQEVNERQDGEIDTLSNKQSELEGEIDSVSQRVTAVEGDVQSIKQDYVSKSATALQTIQSPVSVATSLSVNGTKVVGTRVTGFTDLSGSGYFGSFNADLLQTISSTYQQSESQALATQIQTARRRIKALEDALKAHGLISI